MKISVSLGMVTMGTGSEQQVSPEEKSTIVLFDGCLSSHRWSHIIHHHAVCDINNLHLQLLLFNTYLFILAQIICHHVIMAFPLPYVSSQALNM